jgi:hypothetical protein
MAKAKTSVPGTRTYILTLVGGNVRKITIPSNWKLTFGQLVPHTLRATNGGSSQVALRLYEGTKENLRAVYTDVISFRDDSFSVMEKRTQVQRKASQKQTSQGMKDVVVEARVTEWVNPDSEDDTDTPSEFLSLTAPGSKSVDF